MHFDHFVAFSVSEIESRSLGKNMTDWLTSQILHVGLSNSRGYDTPSSSCGEDSSHPFKCINARPCEFLGISLDQPKARCSSTAASNASISNGSAGLHRGLCTSCHHWHCTRRSAKVSGTCQVDRLVLGLATSSGWVVRTATPTRLVATSTTGSVKSVPMSHFLRMIRYQRSIDPRYPRNSKDIASDFSWLFCQVLHDSMFPRFSSCLPLCSIFQDPLKRLSHLCSWKKRWWAAGCWLRLRSWRAIQGAWLHQPEFLDLAMGDIWEVVS